MLLTEDNNTAKYLFSLWRLKPGELSDSDTENLRSQLESKLTDNILRYSRFKEIWTVYSNKFTEGDVLRFYEIIVNAGNYSPDSGGITAFLAHQPVIENKFI
jgi:hypothetical protein